MFHFTLLVKISNTEPKEEIYQVESIEESECIDDPYK